MFRSSKSKKSTMGRQTRGREKRKKGSHTSEQIKKGIELHQGGMSIRDAAKNSLVSYPTLRRYILKYKNDATVSLVPNYEVNRVFNEEQEASLKEYIIECADKFYGLTSKEFRRVAYQMAKINNIKIPPLWHKEEIAGKDWLRSYRKRHPDLSVKKPEACSLARATSFNRENVQKFFSNLKDAINRHPSFGNGSRLYNLDETSTTTVQRPQKVLAPIGRSSCKVTSGERGVLVTTCCFINAIGQSLPPVMVFPRKHFKPHMLNGAPPGTLGLATPSGWMNGELFVQVMEHFIKFTSAKENPALLIMDNHESHLSIKALDLAKDSGITVLILHPHTTAKLQPLDVGILAPFKTYYNSAVDSWLMRNPGQTYGIYNIAECVGSAYMKAMTLVNISNAFRKCGIFPLDENIFSEVDFLPSEVTNRPAPATTDITENEIVELDSCESPSILTCSILNDHVIPILPEIRHSIPEHSKVEDCQPSTIICKNLTAAAGTNSVVRQVPSQFVSPKVFRPPLKAGPRKGNRQKRRAGKSMIATDTPEKNALAELKQKKNIKIVDTVKTDLFSRKRKKVESDSSDTECEAFECSGSSSGGEGFLSESDVDETILDDNFLPLSRKPRLNDYVIILFKSKKSNIYYVVKVIEELKDENLDYIVSYLKLKSKWNQTFSEPLEPDTAGVSLKEIKIILPSPKVEGTNRRQDTYKFAVDMSLLNMRY